jgi:hypothetical protein
MRRVTVFLGVLALVALAATSAQATFVYGVYMDASGGIPNNPPDGTNPYATSNGRVWINTGSGPTLMTQDVNATLLVYDTALTTPAWTVLEGYPYNSGDPGEATSSTLLLSGPDDPDLGTPPAVGDITFWSASSAYHGVFLDPSGNIYVIPGATANGSYQFQMQMWTGTQYTSYAAAVGQPGTYTGESAVFTANAIGGPQPPSNAYGFIPNMPAIILQQVTVPEPSTLLLTAFGLISLLAYAWRKQK